MANTAVLTWQSASVTAQAFVARTQHHHALTMDSGERAIAPSPVDAVLAALGACSGMDVISILRKKRQDVTGYELRLESERRTEHPRIFTRITVHHVVRGRGVSRQAVEDAIRLSDTTYCTVHAILAPTAQLTSSFEIVEG